jgi:predicted transcriptional regulator
VKTIAVELDDELAREVAELAAVHTGGDEGAMVVLFVRRAVTGRDWAETAEAEGV